MTIAVGGRRVGGTGVFVGRGEGFSSRVLVGGIYRILTVFVGLNVIVGVGVGFMGR
jgi:hypothetical protein